jgi:hypothetical protein
MKWKNNGKWISTEKFNIIVHVRRQDNINTVW